MCQEVASGPGFRFPVADYRRDDQVGIIERGAAGVRKHIAEFAAFMNRARRFRSAVTADAARERELLEELPQSGCIFALVGVDLGVGALQVDRRRERRERRGLVRRGRSCSGHIS